MHGLDMVDCPTKAPNPCDVAAEDVNPPCMVMQHAQDYKPTPQAIHPSSNVTHNNGPLVGPSFNNTYHDEPRPATHSGLTTQPIPHSYFEHPLSHPIILPTGDGNAGTTVERTVPRTHSRTDSKLCSHSSPPTDCNAMESNDANAVPLRFDPPPPHSHPTRSHRTHVQVHRTSHPYHTLTRHSHAPPVRQRSIPTSSSSAASRTLCPQPFSTSWIEAR